MAGRFQNPYPQFSDSTPTMYSGAKLFFYAAGTATKQNTYSDRSLSSANTNPVVLNSAGRPAVEIWLQDLDYKVVLAPSTDTDPPTSPIWSSDYVRARDSALIAKTLTGSGSPSGVVAGTAGSASILPDFYWDYTNAILYVCTTTGTTSTAVWTAVNASTAAAVVPMPQGYLTLTSATPVITGDVTAATSVYYALDQGNLVPIYNGTSFTGTAFTELTLSLVASHAASNIYDVFIFSNAGVLALVTGPSWSAGTSGSITAGSCARGTGAGGTSLARVNGIYTNNVQIMGRNGSTTYTIAANLATYVGTLFMDGTNGQISCHRSVGQSRKWGVWNAYNRRPIKLLATDATASWAGASATWRQSNGAAGNTVATFTGLPEEIVSAEFLQKILSLANGNTTYADIGIGVNSTTVLSGTLGENYMSAAAASNTQVTTTPKAAHDLAPSLGLNNINMIEQGPLNASSNTHYGSSSFMRMTVSYRG